MSIATDVTNHDSAYVSFLASETYQKVQWYGGFKCTTTFNWTNHL